MQWLVRSLLIPAVRLPEGVKIFFDFPFFLGGGGNYFKKSSIYYMLLVVARLSPLTLYLLCSFLAFVLQVFLD